MPDLPVAVVTGAGRGIGRAIAAALAKHAHRVVVNYAHSEQAAEELVAEIKAGGGEAVACQADIASTSDRTALIERTINTFGRIDVLVNNAGITSQGRKDLLEATEESWDKVFGTNLKGPFFLSQAAANAMLRLIESGKIAGGTLINISSVSAYAVSTNRADYCMTKAALGVMTWLFADRLASHGIQVFEICPGVIATDMTGPVKDSYDRAIAEGLQPIRRWGQPDDVAQAVLAIVGGHFPFSTGERFNVDGGFHIRRL